MNADVNADVGEKDDAYSYITSKGIHRFCQANLLPEAAAREKSIFPTCPAAGIIAAGETLDEFRLWNELIPAF